MTMTKTRFFSVLLAMVLLTRPAYAGEPRDPILPDESPFDWQCTYPFTETNCGEVIASWAEDHLDDPEEGVGFEHAATLAHEPQASLRRAIAGRERLPTPPRILCNAWTSGHERLGGTREIEDHRPHPGCRSAACGLQQRIRRRCSS